MAFATIGTAGIQAQSIDLSTKVTGTLPVPNGGLGIASGTTGQFLKFTGTETLAPAEAGGGKVLQCLSYTQGAATVTSSTSYVNFSSMLVTITPSAANSKILILHSAPATVYTDNNSNLGQVAIFRGSTNITTLGHNSSYAAYSATDYHNGASIIYLDSPNSTSALEYRVKVATDNSGLQFVYGSHYSNGGQPDQSSLTCMEIAA
jgi:hypothetical protein